MEKNELLSKVAAGILNGYNINHIVDILKSHALFQAETYHDGLDEEGREALEHNIVTADAQIAKQQEEAKAKAQEAKVEETPVEVVD